MPTKKVNFNLGQALSAVNRPVPPKTTSEHTWSADDKKIWTNAKRQYSDDLSREFSSALETSFRTHFPNTQSGGGTGTGAASTQGIKSVDVAFNIAGLFLGLGISVKTVGLPEGKRGYGHNFKRLTEEWTTETILYHRYMPVAIIVGVLFIPLAATTDRPKYSSLYYGVNKFRGFQGRTSIRDDHELLEKIYIGLFDDTGTTVFVDTQHDVPALGLPSRTSSLEEIKDDLVKAFRSRNPKLRVKQMPNVTESGAITAPPPELEEDDEQEE